MTEAAPPDPQGDPDRASGAASADSVPAAEPLLSLPANLFANWPPELLEAWARFRLPSLHELMTAQELLASEVRKQNLELRRVAEAVAAQAATAAGASATIAATNRLASLADGLRAAAEVLQQRLLQGLIEATDSAVRHHQALDRDRLRLMALLPRRGWLRRPLAVSEALDRSLHANCDGARLLVQRLHQQLGDLGAERLAPTAGQPFDPAWMRCTGRAPGLPDRVVGLERDGWRLNTSIIRPADVLVGKVEA